jgi:putative Mg2+ transporter-C (MgtC) family protein
MGWLLSNWYEQLPAGWANAALALIALLCGAIVGIERERREKSAGLRTLSLVTLGAAVFTMASFAITGPNSGRGRIESQIVTGIGFLGAGAILRGPLGVQGLTTAATIWALAAIGMVVGAGYPIAGLGLSFAIVALLTLASAAERRYLGPCKLSRCSIGFDPTGGKARVKIDEILTDYQIPSEGRRFSEGVGGVGRLELSYCHAHKHHREFLTRLTDLPETREIQTGL